MYNKDKFEEVVWEVATIIKLVAGMNVKAVCSVAQELKNEIHDENFDEVSNQHIYEKYCDYEGGVN